MNPRTPDLFSMLREAAPVRLPGRPQSMESVEREKGFAERSAQLAKLRALRLEQPAPAEVIPKRRKAAAK